VAAGRGEPVVCIHGSFIADTFRPLLAEPRMADQCWLILYHRRGYAGSSRATRPVSIATEAADCLGLLHHLGVERAHGEAHRLLLTWLPHAKGFVLLGATHFLQVEHPCGTAEGLSAFFARHRLPDRRRLQGGQTDPGLVEEPIPGAPISLAHALRHQQLVERVPARPEDLGDGEVEQADVDAGLSGRYITRM
jgi:hypothetical protein